MDYHTAGEPFRIVAAGLPGVLPGETVAERRAILLRPGTTAGEPRDTPVDTVRRMLCHEPRGHADMYGGFVVPPDDEGAHLGVLFWHKDGYSTACGHGTIALGVWAVDAGIVPAPDDGEAAVRIDVPSGRVTARVRRVGGRTVGAVFRNVPSAVAARGINVETSFGTAAVDVAHSGACYASLSAAALGLSVVPERYADLIRAGREIKAALAGDPSVRHPEDPRLSGVYGVIFHDELPSPVGESGPEAVHQRSVTVFADGQVDRSPCGSGTSARLALLHADGRIPTDGSVVLRHTSIVGSEFIGRVVGVDAAGAVLTEVEGDAYRTGEHRFVLDPHDGLGTGFVLR
ncbi:proline racemase family protein [Yinghuangia seranimata]|uniref:proline racemase family protein n=1 Tax=Yinghuangia seranimata TaxID=408067 RepID=UPI00248BA329|nr:proline racemase family protein [Yinghuangia seranimata]MDI2132053.1 proline racemase family protein [Yinghuangia seranimata]